MIEACLGVLVEHVAIQQRGFYIRVDGKQVPTIVTDEEEEAFMESATEFLEDPEDYSEEIRINLDRITFHAQSLLFENHRKKAKRRYWGNNRGRRSNIACVFTRGRK